MLTKFTHMNHCTSQSSTVNVAFSRHIAQRKDFCRNFGSLFVTCSSLAALQLVSEWAIGTSEKKSEIRR